MTEQYPLLASGRWLYGGSRNLEFRIYLYPFWVGSGDEEDEPNIRDDKVGPAYVVKFQTAEPLSPWTGGGQYESLNDAKQSVASTLGPTLRWDDIAD